MRDYITEGLKNDAFAQPIITPSTKAEQGLHDEDISREHSEKEIVSEANYMQLEKYTRALFARGQQFTNERGLILVDTNGGKAANGTIVLIDEIRYRIAAYFT